MRCAPWQVVRRHDIDVRDGERRPPRIAMRGTVVREQGVRKPSSHRTELITMRSLIEWLSEFYSQRRNPYLRLSEADRNNVGIRATVLCVVVAVIFTIWRLLHP